ncbi:hypothetical protein [Nocardia vaccinii]|uniref:hypothetical protein n=1 Tax=Nocardia vaccinii TaxID=1822 RepID=UPI0008332833|nr:hypothetical protein [Nocardia vaccinii]
MRSELTRAQAQDRLYRYFVQTLRALPAELALSLVHPKLPKARFHNGVVLPFDENDPDVDLEFFDIAYWVIGTTSDSADESFDLVVRVWQEFGRPIRTDRSSRPRAAYTYTADGYGLSVRQSVDGSVSLAGSTPPFPAHPREGRPLPESIEHPGAAAESGPAVLPPDTEHRSTPWGRNDPRPRGRA